MLYASLFGKLFEIDLAAPDVPARWWFIDGWVSHALTNQEPSSTGPPSRSRSSSPKRSRPSGESVLSLDADPANLTADVALYRPLTNDAVGESFHGGTPSGESAARGSRADCGRTNAAGRCR